MRPKSLLVWSVGILAALILILYAGDFAWFEYREWKSKPNDPFETLTFYYATATKNGRVEVFYDQPQTQTCAHSLFPHAGYVPCWYLKRSEIKRIGLMIPRLEELQECGHFAGCARPEVSSTFIMYSWARPEAG